MKERKKKFTSSRTECFVVGLGINSSSYFTFPAVVHRRVTAAESMSFTHCGCSSPSLKELLKAVRLRCMGWPPFSCHRLPHWVNRSSKNSAGLLDQCVQFIPLPAEIQLTNTNTVIGAPTALHRSRGSIADTTCCVFTCSVSLVQPTGRTSQRSWLSGEHLQAA